MILVGQEDSRFKISTKGASMNIENVAGLLSLCFLIASLIFIALGIYEGYRRIESSTQKERRKYLVGVIFMSLSLFTLLVLENGLSPESFVFPICLTILLYMLITINLYIRGKTEEFTGALNFSSLKARIQKFLRNNLHKR